MNFKEFITLQESVELSQQMGDLDENWLTSGLKFAGGAAGNLLGQTVKGAANIAGGAGKALTGTGQSALGGLQFLGGGSKQGKKNLASGVQNIGKGIGQAIKGGAQVGVSPATALVRGAQATGEKLAPEPLAKDRSWLQKTFGLNTWDKQKQNEPTQIQPNQNEPSQSQPADSTKKHPETNMTQRQTFEAYKKAEQSYSTSTETQKKLANLRNMLKALDHLRYFDPDNQKIKQQMQKLKKQYRTLQTA